MIKRKLFILIEFLVVLAIIALLMAILMPALQRARKQARSVICRSNLEQWSMAVMSYAADYQDMLLRDSYHSAGMVPAGHRYGVHFCTGITERWPAVFWAAW